ncbi:MAG TPA: VWA domain-containing protein, partial [Planctomycetaceae bacterium]|nr:VWA domain-containing protein [Planctomycetaceae bacterium]
ALGVKQLIGDADQSLPALSPSENTRGGQQKNESGQLLPTDANGNGVVSSPTTIIDGYSTKGRGRRQEAGTVNENRVDFDFNIQEPYGQSVKEDTKITETRVNREQLFDSSQIPDPRIEFKPIEESDTVDQFKTRPAIKPSEGRGPDNRGDNYAPIVENPFQVVTDAPLSTFSIDVDTASYSNIRRILSQNQMLPPPDAVRIEEMVNYFNYTYPAPVGDDPFSVNVDQMECPWQPKHRLVRIGLKGREFPDEERPASNLVFLLDVSGSMSSDNKLPLLKSCLKMMVDYLSENDRVAIVVYAGSSGLVLPSTTGDSKAVIMEALDRLNAGGSTNGGAGIELAYKTAVENFIEGGSNRVILATDGDFNVGTTGEGDLQRLIEEKAKSGVFLTTLGFGYGNLQDNTIELLANKGNGNYAYIDSLREGRKVLIDEMGSTLNTIAKDVKIQIEFNPVKVAAYRLIGYENRVLRDRDFNDDTIDAGEIGAGHTVTALYELIPAGDEPLKPEVDELEFQKPTKPTKAAKDGDMMVVKLRYKQPDGDTSDLLKLAVPDTSNKLNEPSLDLMFASQVASFGMLLRGSKYSGVATYDSVLEIAQSTLGENPESYRTEFIELVKLAKQYDRRGGRAPATGGF